MKYIFVIHSHTVFLTALGTIEYLSLDKKDVIFFYARNYKNTIIKPSCTIIDISEMYKSYQTGRKVLINRGYRKKKIREADEFVDRYIGEDYILFVPHFAFTLFQLLYTNHHCRKACYLQEGGIPFKQAYSITFPWYKRFFYSFINKTILSDGRIKLPRKWYVDGFLSKQGEVDAFAVSKTFFKYLPADIHIVKWPIIDTGVTIQSNCPIFVFDGFISNHHIEKDFYYMMCRKIIEKEKKSINYIKFHPMQSKEERLDILSFFKKEDNCISLDDNIPFELILASKESLRVIGFESSLLYFARDLGHEVVFYGQLLNRSKLFARYKEKSY